MVDTSRSLTKMWDGTSRPKWAGSVRVGQEAARISRAYTDTRLSEDEQDTMRQPRPRTFVLRQRTTDPFQRPSRQIYRPVQVRGVIVPVKTSLANKQRDTADVPKRNLRSRPEDRGHMMALSLGAEDDKCIMLDQPRIINQKLKDGFSEENLNTRLSWRALEIYAQWCALCGIRKHVPGATPPKPKTGDNIKLAPNCIYVNAVKYRRFPAYAPATFQQSNVGKVEPAFKMEWCAEITYYGNRRGNSPQGVTITLTLVEGSTRTEICRNEYRMRHSPVQEDAMLERAGKRKRTWISASSTAPRKSPRLAGQ